MGIRSRIFFIVFILLTISIAITYVVAERDLNNTFKQQTLNELEKKANLLVISVGSLARFDDIKAADLFANELGNALNSRITFIKNDGQVVGDSELDFDEISIEELGLKAKRPKNIALSNKKITKLLGYDLPHVIDAIFMMKLEYKNGYLAKIKNREIKNKYEFWK